jgi:hypothetical protein
LLPLGLAAHQKCTRWLVGVFVLKMPKATLCHGTSHVTWGAAAMPNELPTSPGAFVEMGRLWKKFAHAENDEKAPVELA